jgi:hypothetical protein
MAKKRSRHAKGRPWTKEDVKEFAAAFSEQVAAESDHESYETHTRGASHKSR